MEGPKKDTAACFGQASRKPLEGDDRAHRFLGASGVVPIAPIGLHRTRVVRKLRGKRTLLLPVIGLGLDCCGGGTRMMP